jgi:hypothetical protein
MKKKNKSLQDISNIKLSHTFFSEAKSTISSANLYLQSNSERPTKYDGQQTDYASVKLYKNLLILTLAR